MSQTINTTNFDKVYKKLQTSGYKGTQKDLISFIQKPEGLTKVYNKLGEIGYKGTAQDFTSYLTQPVQLGDFPTPQIQKAAPATALDNLFDVYFKQFGGINKNDTENYNNLQAIEKASAKIQEVQAKIKTTDDLNLFAQADIENQKQKLARLEETQSSPDYATLPYSSDLNTAKEKRDFQKQYKELSIKNIEQQTKELENTQKAWQSLMQEKVGIGYNEQSLKKVKELQATINEDDLFNTAVDVYNVGNFSKQRILKSLYNEQLDREKMQSPFLKAEESSVGLSQPEKDFYIYKGAEIQKQSLDYSIKTEQETQKEIKIRLLDFEKQIGNNPPSDKEKEYLNNLNYLLKESINNEKEQTLLKDKISMIGDKYGKSFKLYEDVKKRQSEGLESWLSPILKITPNLLIQVSKSKSAVKQISASLRGVPEEDIEKYRLSYNSLINEDINAIAQNKFISSYTPTTSYDEESWKNETLTYINEKGERVWNPTMILPTALKIGLESNIMGIGGAATSFGTGITRGITTGAGMYVPTSILYGGDIFNSYKERGVPTSKAGVMTLTSLLAETASELINPVEVSIAKGDGFNLINLTKSQAGRELYKNTVRQITGSGKFDKLIDFLTSSQRLTTEVSKQIGLEYVEELTSALATYIQENTYKSYIDPTFEVENELNLSDQITTFVTTAVGMSLMGGYQGFNKLKEYNKSAAFLVGKDPQVYIEQIKKDLELGKITPEIANAQMQAVSNADLTYQLLKEDFDYIDKLVYKSGKPVEDEVKEEKKYELFKQSYTTKILQDLILREKDPKKQEEILSKLDEYLLEFESKKQTVLETPTELTELEKLNNYLNSEFSEQYVNNLGVPSTIKDNINLLQSKLEQVEEDLKPVIQEKINLLENRLKDLNQITETTPLTEEEYNNYAKILLDEDIINQAEYDQFTPEELKAVVDEYINKQNEELSEFNVDLEDIKSIEDPEERLQKALEYKEELYKQPKKDKQKELISSYIDELEPLVEQVKTEKSLKERILPISFNDQPLYKENYVILKDNSIWKIDDFEDNRLKLSSKEGEAILTKNLSDPSDIVEQLSPEEAFSRFKELARKKQEARIKELESKTNLTPEELKELQSLTLQNPVIEELEEETTPEDEDKLNEEVRTFENGQKALNPLRTQVLGKKPQPLSVEERWYNFLFFLRDLQNKNPFKTFKELGYTVSIVSQTEIPFEQLPQGTKAHITKAFNKSSQKDFNSFYQEYSKDYKTLIITDENGKPVLKDGQYLLSFLYNVEKTTDEEGKDIYKFEDSKVTRPSEEQLAKNNLDELWFQNQLKALYNLKRATENQTFEITSISKGVLEDKSTEFKQTSTLTKNPEISLSITGAVQNKPAKKGTAYIDINSTQYLLYRNSLPQDLVDIIWILSQPNPSKSDLGIYSTLPSELHDFYDRVSHIKSLIYIGDQLKTKEGNIRNGLILDKETKKWYLDGVQINTKEELTQILSNKRINIDKNTLLNSQPYPIITFSNNTFTTKYTTYPKFISENTQIKYLLGDESRINPYLEFSSSPEPPVQFATQEEMQEVFGVTVEKAPTSDLEAKKADIERRRQEELKNTAEPRVSTKVDTYEADIIITGDKLLVQIRTT